MTHLFLSPHLDDAVLSCGGLIHQLAARGDQVEILTIMAGDPPANLPDTPLVNDLHRRWGLGRQPMQARRDEDADALAYVKATGRYLDTPDCPYRVGRDGQALYPTNNDLFGEIHPEDPALSLMFTVPKGITAVYAPLGVGGHVDHLVVNTLAKRLAERVAIFFYEDYPYSANTGEAARITHDPDIQIVGNRAVEIALARFERPLSAYNILLSEDDIDAKIDAVACYKSQISTFWDDTIAMEDSIREYSMVLAPNDPPGAERLWVWKE